MAKMNGTILLTEKQISFLVQGKPVNFRRDGKKFVLGVKSRVEQKMAIKREIKKLQKKLKKV